MTLVNAILELIFPSKCLVCGTRGTLYCLDCLTSAPAAERECASWIFPLYDYRHPPIKKAVWFLKYKRRRGLAEIFAQVLYGRILEELSDLSIMENFSSPIIIPIPLSPARLRERGFNQALLLAKNLLALDQKENFSLEADILLKPKDTKHQAHTTNRTERLKNLSGTFSVRSSEKIKGRNIILLDDVITTGATLSEARKVLREAGARKIVAFTVAH